MARIPWDRRSPSDQQRQQNVLLRQTVLQAAFGQTPLAARRLEAAGIDARLFKGLEELGLIPPSTRRDVLDPVRNPDGPRAVVIEGTAEGIKRFSDRRVLWKVARARLVGGPEAQELAIEAATRPIHLHAATGIGGTVPVAYTREDLDLLARAGGRLASVLGLSRDDRLLNLVPSGPSIEFWGIFYMAHGTGMSALHARSRAVDLAKALTVMKEGRPTAVAVPAEEAARFPAAAAEAGIDCSELSALVAVGRSLGADERAAIGEGLADAGAAARISAVYGPAEGRVLWGECAVPSGRTETFGFHTYPDLEIVEILSPDTGAGAGMETPGEITITPLGFRGGGMPRWRTGDLALGGLTLRPCPNCGRTVARIGPSVQRGAWVRRVVLDGAPGRLDLRDVGVAARGRARDWQLELVAANGAHELFVYVSPLSEDGRPVVELYEDLARWQAAPTQIVLSSGDELRSRLESASGRWPRLWERSG